MVDETYVDHVLADTASVFTDAITCKGTSKESMALLFDRINLYVNQNEAAEGSVGECAYPNKQKKVCQEVHSYGDHECAGERCAGIYQGIGVEHMDLPAGYVWNTYPKNACFLLNPQDLYCGYYTKDITVSPTD